MINIVVAAKIWANHWANKKIQILCDNLAVVQVINTDKARDPTLETCAQNLLLLVALFNIEFVITHIPGKVNVVADLLHILQACDALEYPQVFKSLYLLSFFSEAVQYLAPFI